MPDDHSGFNGSLPPNRTARQGFLNVIPIDDRPFRLQPVTIPDPTTIPPREWIYGSKLIRGFVTLLIAPGGTGKSTLALAACMEIASAKRVLGIQVFDPCNVAFLNLEDPRDEMNRRLAALAIRYGITNRDLEGRLFMSDADRAVTIATMGADGFTVTTPDKDEIIRRVRAHNIGVLSVDPFAESHTLEENSNPQMVKAAAAWRQVARDGNCAVLLAHHVRKGAVTDIESARGAKALTDSARIGLLLSHMTADEAASLRVPADKRLSYVRLHDAKANLSPRATEASWFHLDNIKLENSTAKYPAGDSVAVLAPWKPPTLSGGMDATELRAVFDELRRTKYAAVPQTKYRPWAGQILIEVGGRSREEAHQIITSWITHGVVRVIPYRVEHRHTVNALELVEERVAAILREIGSIGCAV
jgi:AAA domain